MFNGLCIGKRYLSDIKRASYECINDEEAIEAFLDLTRTEGIVPAIESSHALAYAKKLAPTLDKDKTIIVNLSGRGDKDMDAIISYLENENK